MHRLFFLLIPPPVNISIFWHSMPVKLHGFAFVLLAMWINFAPSISITADAKVSKYDEDALVRYEKKDLVGAIFLALVWLA